MYCQYDGYPEHMLQELNRRGYQEVYGIVLRAMGSGGVRVLSRKDGAVLITRGEFEFLGDPDCACENAYVSFVYIVQKDGSVRVRRQGSAEWQTRRDWEWENGWD
tara:strand:- start:295 stop:609 length:315 start_codon:yes stop_codon:yes gene_type:complete